jgi:hypothetical protein
MSFKAYTKTSTIDYVSKDDPDMENPTIFKLGYIPRETLLKASSVLFNQMDVSKLENMTEEEIGNMLMKHNDTARYIDFSKAILKRGIKGIENLEGFEWKGEVTQDLLDVLYGSGLYAELTTKILEINKLGTDRKN